MPLTPANRAEALFTSEAIKILRRDIREAAKAIMKNPTEIFTKAALELLVRTTIMEVAKLLKSQKEERASREEALKEASK